MEAISLYTQAFRESDIHDEGPLDPVGIRVTARKFRVIF